MSAAFARMISMAIAIVGLGLPGTAFGAEPAARPLEIYFIDVLGGAATLLVTPERESILIDSGWPGWRTATPSGSSTSSRTSPAATTSTT